VALSIYYSGVLREVSRLPELVAEVTDICHDLHWNCEIIEEEAPVSLYGLGFSVPGGEPVWLTFDTKGSLASPGFVFLENAPAQSSTPSITTSLETVVQYSGPETHMRLVNLLQYISKKYFSAFELIDESEYWETGCAERCRDWFEMFACWQDVEHAMVFQ
jgi:hypothetical protein